MSVVNLLKDIFTGNFTSAEERIKDWWSGLAPSIQAFLGKIETDEGTILTGLAETAAQDVITGGLTTASFVSAAKDIEGKLASQEVTLARTDIFAALNAAVGYLQGTSTVPVVAPATIETAPATDTVAAS